MDIDQLLLQRDRLRRHYERALGDRDPISFLDLAHVLRLWTELKRQVDDLASARSVRLDLPVVPASHEAKQVLRGAQVTYLPLGSGVDSPGIQVRGVRIINRALGPEEVKRLYEAGLPKAAAGDLTLAEWLASAVYQVPSGRSDHPHLMISREVLIKRVANVLGASHPAGAEDAVVADNRFDSYIRELHTLQVAGYPATYYQLLEIAKDLLNALDRVLQPDGGAA